MPSRRSRSSCPLTLALVLGCYTGVDGPDGGADAGQEGGAEGADDGADDGGEGPAADDCVGFDAGLRRLSLREYARALSAALGTDVDIGEGFPADDRAHGYDSDASLLSVSAVWLTAHDQLAEQALADALAPGTPTRDAILICTPAGAGQESACAEEILTAFGLKAWRRPVADDELAELVGFVAVAQSEGEGFEEGITLALQAVLMSPNFVFKVEADRAAGERVDAFELATRLAFFLWSGPPDDALLAAATDGSLLDDDRLRSEVARMLTDARAEGLHAGFVAQWLTLAKFEDYAPLASAGALNDALRDAMEAETRMGFDDALAQDLALADLVASPEILVNDVLAAHYGIAGIAGSEFRRVDGASEGRYGLLTQGAILTLSSHPAQSSPTRRGEWVMDRLLCAAPPPPPANVDNTLPDPEDPGPWSTIREFLEQTHLADPECAACHQAMDPVGFALENYDAVGAHRTQYANGAAIDPSGELPGAGLVAGPQELSDAVAGHPDLQTCVARQLVAYAANRAIRTDDACMANDALADGAVGLMSLFEAIATHPTFAAAAAPEDG